MGVALEHKLDGLDRILRSYGSVCVGYSGGVDSAFLAKFATDALGADRVLAVTGVSAAIPAEQLEAARLCASQFGIQHLEVPTDELSDPNYTANPSNRCYFCKTELWRVLTQVAAQRDLAVLVDGTNADDIGDHRPGARAGQEWSIRSPLLEAGFTKTDIREASRDLRLPTWDQPAAPCLSSRLPYGLAVTPARLRQVELAEAGLRRLGLREFRVRHHGTVARIELGAAELTAVSALGAALARVVAQAGFERVLLDVDGYRRGALNAGVKLIQLRASA